MALTLTLQRRLESIVLMELDYQCMISYLGLTVTYSLIDFLYSTRQYDETKWRNVTTTRNHEMKWRVWWASTKIMGTVGLYKNHGYGGPLQIVIFYTVGSGLDIERYQAAVNCFPI